LCFGDKEGNQGDYDKKGMMCMNSSFLKIFAEGSSMYPRWYRLALVCIYPRWYTEPYIALRLSAEACRRTSSEGKRLALGLIRWIKVRSSELKRQQEGVAQSVLYD